MYRIYCYSKHQKNCFANSSTAEERREVHQSFDITYKQFIKELNIYGL